MKKYAHETNLSVSRVVAQVRSMVGGGSTQHLMKSNESKVMWNPKSFVKKSESEHETLLNMQYIQESDVFRTLGPARHHQQRRFLLFALYKLCMCVLGIVEIIGIFIFIWIQCYQQLSNNITQHRNEQI